MVQFVRKTVEFPQLQWLRSGGRCPCCSGRAGFSSAGSGGHSCDPTVALAEKFVVIPDVPGFWALHVVCSS